MASKLFDQIDQTHLLYCRLTAQNLSLRFGRQRLWYEFFRAGFSQEQLTQVITYLQKEIRYGRRNVGALKLYNLLQPDRFEEDLNISRVRLRPPSAPKSSSVPTTHCSPREQNQGRQRALNHLRQLKEDLRKRLP